MAHTYLKINLKELADLVYPVSQVGLSGASDFILEMSGSNLIQDT